MNRKIRRLLSLITVILVSCMLASPAWAYEDEGYDYDEEAWEEAWREAEEYIYVNDYNSYCYVNPETGYEAVVEDDADRLSDDEEYYLLSYMYTITEFGSAYYKTILENPYGSTSTYAENYLNDEKGCYGGESGVVFLDDTENRRLEIFSNGYIYKYVRKGKAVSITDNVYRYASEGQYYDCAAEAFYEIETLLYNGTIAEPMKYTSNFFLAIIIALMLCFIVAICTSATFKASVEEVMNAAISDLEFTNVRKIHTGQTKVYDPPSSSDSSSSGGGGGGGGGGGHSY